MTQLINKRYFVTGIDTDVGKSVICAILIQKLAADYWKPIQAGYPTDSEFIKSISDNIIIHPEGIILQHPMSPHAAAEKENQNIYLSKIKLPNTKNTLIIEGAGGVMVPINKTEMVIDLARQIKAGVILVSKNYLGSINHTLLSVEYLKSNGFNIVGIIFNGPSIISSENYILNYTGLNCIAHIPEISNINFKSICELSSKIHFNL